MLTRASRWSRRAATSLASPAAAATHPRPPPTPWSARAAAAYNRRTNHRSAPSAQLKCSAQLAPTAARRAAPEQQQYEDERDHAEAITPSNVSDELSGTDPAIPWFLQTETVDPPAEPLTEESTSEPVDTAASNAFSYIPLQPKVEVPRAVWPRSRRISSVGRRPT